MTVTMTMTMQEKQDTNSVLKSGQSLLKSNAFKITIKVS